MGTTGDPVKENGKSDATISDACTRSGAFALLISIVVCLLVPYWRARPNEIALGRYIADRFNLVLTLETLDDDPIWQKYKTSHAAAETMSIFDLSDAQVAEVTRVESNADAGMPTRKPAPSKAGTVRRLVVPVPPTGLRARIDGSTEIPEIGAIADLMGQLNDSETLSLSRRISNFFNFSIVRWIIKRNDIASANASTLHCFTQELQEPLNPAFPSDYVPVLKAEALRKCLTLKDVRELAQVEYPTVSNQMQLGGHLAQDVSLTPGSFPRDLFSASIFAVVLLAFLLMYFNAFAHEAVLSTAFPARGTLFAAFSRSRVLLGLFLLALCAPLAASLWLTLLSRNVAILICTAVVASAVVWTFQVLQKRSYFSPLWAPDKPKSHTETNQTGVRVEDGAPEK